jgi:hypothetical protein
MLDQSGGFPEVAVHFCPLERDYYTRNASLNTYFAALFVYSDITEKVYSVVGSVAHKSCTYVLNDCLW